MVGENVFHRITDKCSLVCDHCVYSCTPDGFVPELETVLAVMPNLPKNMKRYILTGGEPFESEELLFGSLEYVQDNRKMMPNLEEIGVFTNGLWLTDESRAYDLIEKLNYYDVYVIGISFDKFHVRAARKNAPEATPLSAQFLRDMKEEVGQIYGGKTILWTFGDRFNYYPCPLGRAANLPPHELRGYNRCEVPQTKLEKINVNPRGEVYLCGLEQPSASLGSAIYHPVDDLIIKSRQNPVLNALITKGPKGAARITGTDISEYESLFTAKDCAVCKKIFSELESNNRLANPVT
ncbi:MAG: hypothetical protein JW727_04685 [Candidatus Aenigmarchaeota archaeon]|nr:hypothetical protein [Candidatus Aenigmarchaeota archaeon]